MTNSPTQYPLTALIPTGTVTFLFTDIAGSTTLWEAHSEAMRQVLARHDALLKEAIKMENGYLVKTTGDGVLAAFHTASDALAAALAAQKALAAEAWPDLVRIAVRMGLHTGAADVREGDYFGPVLNRAARLMAAGHGGQVLLSVVTQELCRDTLPDAVELLDLGSHRLKDLDRPEQVFQLTHSALRADFPPLRTMDNTPNNLPQQVTSFIGREKAIAEVTALLGKARLLTLVGPGGTGKTRLSLQVAADMLDGYSEGAWLVELAPLSDAALVTQTVASILGVKEQGGQTLTQTLTDALKAKHLLLVLDNCEHVLTACAQLVAALLRACPQVKVLTTSREPLAISGEQTYRVPSLSLPNATQVRNATVESLNQFEAVRLFIERATLVKLDFTVTNANAPALAQLCFRLDGIPLAIELAAARVRSLSVEQINEKLDTRFRLLTGGDRSALPRQQTLRALVDWSYDLLTDTEKALFARLSYFSGGWTLQAAESIIAFDPVEEWEVLDLLTNLADKSLIVAEEGTGVGDTRYRMLETLKQYGVEKLTDSGETDTLAEWHASYFVALADEAEPELVSANQVIWLNRLETEHDNLRTALSWAIVAESTEGTSIGLRLAGALWRFWDVRGYLGEGRAWLGKALEKGKGDKGPEHAKALSGAALLAMDQGDFDASRQLLEESLLLFRALEDTKNIAYSLGNLGNIANNQGDFTAAKLLYEECLGFCRTLNNKRGIAVSLESLGVLASNQGEYVTAKRLYEESLILHRELGNLISISSALHNLGIAACGMGDFVAASRLHAESIRVYRDLDHKLGIPNALDSFGQLFVETSRFHQSVVVWGASHSLRESIGMARTPNKQADYVMLSNLARAALSQEAFQAAWDEGSTLGMDPAIDYALESASQTQGESSSTTSL